LVQAIDISKDISPFGQNILLGCTYIPPEFSKYSSDDYVIDIEEELLLFSQITKNIAVIGDSVNNRKTVKTVMTLTWYRHF
jgi:hypothetical protein